jgi:hypothetical protein
MSVKSVKYAGNLGSAQSNDQFSRGVWYDCPLEAIRDGELAGRIFEFNFDTLPTTPPTTEGAFGLFSAFTSTGGFIQSATGGAGWDMGSDGDNEGASIRSKAPAFQVDRSTYKFWFEARVTTSTITDTKHNIFVGMMEDAALTATVPITAAGALADQNLFGFFRPETARSTAGTGGAIMNTVYKANGVASVTVQNDAVALSADPYVNLGMMFEPSVDPLVQDPTMANLGKYNLFFYVNGIRCSSYKQIPTAQGTDFPNDVKLGFVFAVLNATATTPGDSTISRVRVAQVLEPYLR